MSEISGTIRSYLEEAFPERTLSEEWDRSRNVLVVRLHDVSGGEPEMLLVELTAELLDSGGAEGLEERLEREDLATLLRQHYRVLVSGESLAPLPWKQLAPETSPVDEASWESFPASDPAPLSSLSRDAPPKGRTR